MKPLRLAVIGLFFSTFLCWAGEREDTLPNREMEQGKLLEVDKHYQEALEFYFEADVALQQKKLHDPQNNSQSLAKMTSECESELLNISKLKANEDILLSRQGKFKADMQSTYVTAWLEIENGFNLIDKKQYKEAFFRFAEAYSKLLFIHQTDANWEPAMLAARDRDCNKELLELPKLEAGMPAPAESMQLPLAPSVAGTDNYAHELSLPPNEEERVLGAQRAFSEQQFDIAADLFQQIINDYPDCLYAWINLGMAQFNGKHFPEAKKSLQQALKLDPGNAEVPQLLDEVMKAEAGK
jgi:tetratricopeptide (TPR) repeat protein